MMRARLAIVLLMLAVLLGTLVFVFVQPLDPLAGKVTVNADGSLTIKNLGPGDWDLIRQRYFGGGGEFNPGARWNIEQSGHPTMSWTYSDGKLPAYRGPVVDKDAPQWLGDRIVAELRRMWDDLVRFVDAINPIGSVRATVALDQVTGAGPSSGTLTWTHTPVGTPRAVVVACESGNTADSFNAVTYGSATLTEVTGSPNVLAGGEGGNVSAFFVGTGIPTGAQTVTVTVLDATSKACAVYTLTAAADTEVVDTDVTINSASLTNPFATLSIGGRTSWATMGLYSGVDTISVEVTPRTNWTSLSAYDLGTEGIGDHRYNIIGSSDVNCGWTQAANDAVAVCLAVSEVPPRYLVLGADCTVTAIGTDAGCWAAASGGATPTTVPTAGSNVFMDGASGSGTGTLDANMNITVGTYSSSGFTGTFAVATFTFQNTGTFTHSGGTIALSTGALSTGAATVSASLTASGAASLTFDGLTISGSTIAKGTASLTVQENLTMSGGDLTSTSGTVSVTGNVDISSASAIDFGSEAWTVTGTWTNASTDGTIWEAGTGTVTFTSATGGTMTFAGTNLTEDEFSSVTFGSSASTAQTFTMATRGLRWGGTLTVTDATGGTILAKVTLALAGGAITLAGAAGGAITSTSGDVTGGAVSVDTAASYIDFGSETWTMTGTWTNSTTSASWDAGTGTVTFNSATGSTMTFAGTNLAEDEFNDVTFDSSGTATFTLAQTIDWAGTLTMSDTGTTVDWNGLVISAQTGATLVVGTRDLTNFDRLDVNGTMTMDGITIPNIDINTDTGTVTITAWTVYTVTSGLPNIRWAMNPSAANASIVFIVEDLSGTTTFSLYRDNIDIRQAASDSSGMVTFTFASGWSPHDMIINIPSLFPPTGGNEGGGGSAPGVGGGGGMFVPGFDATCALGVGDWLLSTTQPGSKTATLDDTRPEAALAILYLVNWGDGEFSRATSTPINHTYEEGKLYNVTVRVQYRNNVIEYFVTFVDVRGNNCALQKFSREIMPILWALGALSIVSAAIVTGARYRIAPNKRRALRRILLTVGIVALGSAMAIVVYAYLAGIPI